MTSTSRARAIGLVLALGLLGACGNSSDSRQRNSTLSGDSPTTVDIPLPGVMPKSIAVSGNSILVASGLGGPMARITPDGVVTVPTRYFDPVTGIVVNADGTFFVANQTLKQVRKIGLDGEVLQTFTFEEGPQGLYWGGKNALVVVLGRGLARINLETAEIVEIGEISEMVREIANDSEGNVYLYDRRSRQIIKIAPDTTQTTIRIAERVHTFTVDDAGNIYALFKDWNSSARLAIIKPGSTQTEYPLNEQILSSASLVLDKSGTVYIIDSFANAVHRVVPGEAVTWKWATTGAGPLFGVFATSGDLYVANMNSNSVSKISTKQNSIDSPPTSQAQLRPGLVPMFGAVEQTRDGFTVPIMNFDPDFTYSASTRQGTAIVSTGMVQVYGLSPDSVATLTVVVSRSGYEDAEAQVAGRSLAMDAPAPDAPASNDDDETTTSVDESTASSVADETTTSMADSGSNDDTASSVQPTEMPVNGEPAEVVQTQGESGSERVLAVPPSVIVAATRNTESSTPTPVLVSPQATEIVCDTGCFTALLNTTDMIGATVTASVLGKEPVAVTLDKVTPIAIGDQDTTISFELTGNDGKKVSVDVPVVHSESVSYLTADEASTSSSRMWWIAVIALALVLLVLLAGLQRRRKSEKTNTDMSDENPAASEV